MITDSATAAAAPAGTDITAGKRYQSAAYLRHWKGIMHVGGVNANDSQIDWYAGDTFVATTRNSRGGANISPQVSTDYMPVDVGVEANEAIHGIVVTQGGTNPTVWALDIDGVS